MLLRNFAGPNGSLRVFAVDREVSYVSMTTGLGQVNGGHNRIGFDGSTDHDFLEQWMSTLEGAAASDIARLVASSELTIQPENYPAIAWLASLQRNRSRAVMGYLSSRIAIDGMNASDLEIQTAILDVTAGKLLAAWEASKDERSRMKDRWDPMVSVLTQLRWDVMRYRRPRLVISDGFAAQYGIAPQHAKRYSTADQNWAKHGVGVPQHEAASFTIPLTPQVALFLHPGAKRRYVSAQQVNQRTIYAARSFVAMPSDWVLPDASLGDVAHWIGTQRFVRSMIAPNM